jgi:hypothetical protein
MLSQSEADLLITTEKKKESKENYTFPMGGESLTIPIVSLDETETFLLDITRGRIRLSKCTYQERYQGIIVLVRLDVDGPPHTNPEVSEVPLPYLTTYNGVTLPCPHLHLYVENFMDKWAIPAPENNFSNTDDLYTTLDDFFKYCYIVDPPNIQRGLFK